MKSKEIDIEKYFQISRKMNLSNRCPLVGKCERWAITLFSYQFYDSHVYASKPLEIEDTLIKKGIIDENFMQKAIRIKAELPEFLRTNDRISYCNMCPEVNLFDKTNAISYAYGYASISGEYDSYRSVNQFQNYENRHYSECLEFNQFIHEELDKTVKAIKQNQSKRAPISKVLRFEIFSRDEFKCQYCGRNQADGVKLHIDHKIPISKGAKTLLITLSLLVQNVIWERVIK